MKMNLIGGRRAYCAVVLGLLLGLPAVSVRAQTISNISGTLSHGNSVALSGSSFGTKATPAPQKWENFEGHTANAVVSTGDGWNSVDGWSDSQSAHVGLPIYSTSAAHSGSLGMMCRNTGDVGNSSVLHRSNFSSGFYLDAWYRGLPSTIQPSNNNKIFMLYGSVNDTPQLALTGFCNLSGSMVVATNFAPAPGGPAGDGTYPPGLQLSDLMGSMHHLQVWITPQSAYGADNGSVTIMVDGVVSARNDLTTAGPVDGYWNQIRIGYTMAHNAAGDCPHTYGMDHFSYWDDVYIDNTQARVELGNASTYAACTHREIQIPTSWSASQVAVTLNQGAFNAGDTAYLYVVTANGAVSPGYQVTLGGTPPSGPGQPGKPVF